MKHKFTIAYKDIRSDAIFSEKGEGKMWIIAARELIKSRATLEGLINSNSSEGEITKACSNFSILFAYRGHQTQLI